MTHETALDSLPADQSLTDFLMALASATPAPGGGAAAALAAALGAALAAMVAGLTIGRGRYADVQAEMVALLGRAETLRRDLAAGIAADIAAYSAVTDAYRLPKETDAQQAARTAAIQAALIGAVEAPLAVAAACVETLELLVGAAAHGNRNASGDAEMAALLVYASLQGAVRNVRINLRSIHDERYCQTTEVRAAELLRAGEQAQHAALAAADARG